MSITTIGPGARLLDGGISGRKGQSHGLGGERGTNEAIKNTLPGTNTS
jgi:hypothetical protein